MAKPFYKTFDKMGFFETENNESFNKLGFAICLCLSLLFLVVQYIYAPNEPRALDDSRMYLLHFSERFLDAENLITKIRYFFSDTNYPHTNLTGRFIAFLYYCVTGTINFKFLIMVGTLALIGFVFQSKWLIRFEYWAIIPLILILFTPATRVTMWVGPMTGYPFLLVYGLACCYLLGKGHLWLATLLAFIMSFTTSPGIVIFFAALPLFLLKQNRGYKILIWLTAFLGTFILYYILVLSNGTLIRAEETRSIINVLECSGSMIVYQGKFLTLPLSGSFYGLGDLSQMENLAGFVSLGTLAMIIAIMTTKWRTDDTLIIVAFAFMLFCLSPGPISAIISDDCSTLTDPVAIRYKMLAHMSWCGIFMFLMSASSKKWRAIITVVFVVLFTPKVFHGYAYVDEELDINATRWVRRATLTDNTKRGLMEREIFLDAMERNLYLPPLPDYEISTVPINEVSIDKLDVWYDLSTNSHNCKIELLVDKMHEGKVEIWIGSVNDPIRYLPIEIPPLRIYMGFKDNENFTLSRRKVRDKVGYQYVARLGEGCEDQARIKVNDALSPLLKPSP